MKYISKLTLERLRDLGFLFIENGVNGSLDLKGFKSMIL